YVVGLLRLRGTKNEHLVLEEGIISIKHCILQRWGGRVNYSSGTLPGMNSNHSKLSLLRTSPQRIWNSSGVIEAGSLRITAFSLGGDKFAVEETDPATDGVFGGVADTAVEGLPLCLIFSTPGVDMAFGLYLFAFRLDSKALTVI